MAGLDSPPTGDVFSASTGVASILREYYADGIKLKYAGYSERPFLAMLKRSTDWSGKYTPVPIQSDAGAGRSATFSSAQAGVLASELDAFQVPVFEDHAVARVSNKAAQASRNNKGAFADLVTLEHDSKVNALLDSLSMGLFLDGSGVIGQGTTDAMTSGVLQLLNPADSTHFSRGQLIQGVDPTTLAVGSYGVGAIIAIDRVLGKITFSATTYNPAAPANPSNWSTAGVKLVPVGDSTGGLTGGLKVQGLQAWLVEDSRVTAAIGTIDSPVTFNNVNRAVDRIRLAGVYYDGSAQNMREALIDGIGLGSREGAHPTVCFVSNAGFQALAKELQVQSNYDKVTVELEEGVSFSYDAITIAAGGRKVSVIADNQCPTGKAFALDMETWGLGSYGECPQLTDYGSGPYIPLSNADGSESRYVYFANLFCHLPGHNIHISTPY